MPCGLRDAALWDEVQTQSSMDAGRMCRILWMPCSEASKGLQGSRQAEPGLRVQTQAPTLHTGHPCPALPTTAPI